MKPPSALRFGKGERVRVHPGAPDSLLPRCRGRLGTVVGYSRDRCYLRVVFDGSRFAQTAHHQFFDRPPAEPPTPPAPLPPPRGGRRAPPGRAAPRRRAAGQADPRAAAAQARLRGPPAPARGGTRRRRRPRGCCSAGRAVRARDQTLPPQPRPRGHRADQRRAAAGGGRHPVDGSRAMTDDDDDPIDLERLAAPRLSPAALRAEAEELRSYFSPPYTEPCAQRWEPAGLVRRSRPGWEVVHLAIPRQDESGGCLVAARLAELEAAGVIETSLEIRRGVGWVVIFRGRPHAVRLTTADCWGPAIAKHTGPEWLWMSLVDGLQAAGRLTLQAGCRVAWIDGDGRLRPLHCPDERDFFRLCRRTYVEPWLRRDVPPAPRPGRPAGLALLGEWYPPSVPYPSARERRTLFDAAGRPRPPPGAAE